MKKGKKTDKAEMRERLCHALDIQPDVFPLETMIEIRGRSSVTVKGSGKVLTYTDSVIRLCVRKGVLRIEGKRLCCASYHVGAAVIDGYVRLVCFEEEE